MAPPGVLEPNESVFLRVTLEKFSLLAKPARASWAKPAVPATGREKKEHDTKKEPITLYKDL